MRPRSGGSSLISKRLLPALALAEISTAGAPTLVISGSTTAGSILPTAAFASAATGTAFVVFTDGVLGASVLTVAVVCAAATTWARAAASSGTTGRATGTGCAVDGLSDCEAGCGAATTTWAGSVTAAFASAGWAWTTVTSGRAVAAGSVAATSAA